MKLASHTSKFNWVNKGVTLWKDLIFFPVNIYAARHRETQKRPLNHQES